MKIVKKKKKRVNKTELVAKEIAAEIKKLGYTVHTKMMASKTAFKVTAPTLYPSWKRLAKASLEKESSLGFLDSEVSIRVEECSWDKEVRVFLYNRTLLTRILVDRRFKERKEKYLPKVVKKFCKEIKGKKDQKRIVIRGLILSEKQLPASFLGKKAELEHNHTLVRAIRFAKGAGFLEHRFDIEEERGYTLTRLSTKSKKDIELFLLEFPKLYKLVERLLVKKARDIDLWYDEYGFNFSKDDEGSMDVSIECTEAADIKAILQTIALFEL